MRKLLSFLLPLSLAICVAAPPVFAASFFGGNYVRKTGDTITGRIIVKNDVAISGLDSSGTSYKNFMWRAGDGSFQYGDTGTPMNLRASTLTFSNGTEYKIRHDANTFHGRIQSDGTANRLPTGWASVKNSTGLYTITHNLNNASYSAVCSARNSMSACETANFGANTFQIAMPADSAASFILMLD